MFYSIHSLPPFWQQVSQFNPFFYMIRTAFATAFGQSDASPWLSLAIVGQRLAGDQRLALQLLRQGYRNPQTEGRVRCCPLACPSSS